GGQGPRGGAVTRGPHRLEQRPRPRTPGRADGTAIGEPPRDARRQHFGRGNTAAPRLGRHGQLAERPRHEPQVRLADEPGDGPSAPVASQDGPQPAWERETNGTTATAGNPRAAPRQR